MHASLNRAIRDLFSSLNLETCRTRSLAGGPLEPTGFLARHGMSILRSVSIEASCLKYSMRHWAEKPGVLSNLDEALAKFDQQLS